MVEVFFVVVALFAPVSFFVVAAVELVVVMDSFLLAHEVNKPTAMRAVMEQISVCFISCG